VGFITGTKRETEMTALKELQVFQELHFFLKMSQ